MNHRIIFNSTLNSLYYCTTVIGNKRVLFITLHAERVPPLFTAPKFHLKLHLRAKPLGLQNRAPLRSHRNRAAPSQAAAFSHPRVLSTLLSVSLIRAQGARHAAHYVHQRGVITQAQLQARLPAADLARGCVGLGAAGAEARFLSSTERAVTREMR